MALRLTFVGNCQVASLRLAAQALLPEAEVTAYHANVPLPPEQIRAAVRDQDFVVTNIADEAPLGPLLGPEAIMALGVRTLYLPSFVFPALHRDIIGLRVDGKPLESPVGQFHSRIAVASFLSRLPVDHAVALFNAHVFKVLGYLDAVEPARVALLCHFKRHGFDLASHLREWEMRPTPFMHMGLHPSIFVLATLATLALEKLGLVEPGTVPPENVRDPLFGSVVLPVFPAIARQARTAPFVQFLRPGSRDLSDRSLSLSDFVNQSYAIYRGSDRPALRTPLIKETRRALRAALAAATYPAPRRSLASASPI
jgi:hypothetical protein